MRTRGVLIVDDDPKVNETIAFALSKDEVPASCVSATSEGMEVIRSHGPAAVIVDVHFLDPVSIKFAMQLRTDEKTRTIPILVITGAVVPGTEETMAELVASGDRNTPVGLMTKPFSMLELKQKLASLVGSSEWINPSKPGAAGT